MASVYSTSRLRYHSHSAEGSQNRRYDTPLDYFDMEAFDREWERRKSESHAPPIDAYEPRERVLWYGYVPTSTGMDIPINSDGGRERYVQTLRDQVGVDPAKTNSLPLPRMDEGDDDDDDVAMLDLRNGSALTSLPRIPPNACDSPAESQLGDEFGDDTLLLRNGEVEEDDDLYMTPPPEERPIAPLPRRLLPPSSFPPTARIVLPTSRASSPASSVDVPLAQSSCASPTSHNVKSPEPPALKLTGRKRKAQTVAFSMPPPKRRGRPPRSRASATRDVSATSTPAVESSMSPPKRRGSPPRSLASATRDVSAALTAPPPPPLTMTTTTPPPTSALTMPAPTPVLSTPAPTSPTPALAPVQSTLAPTSPTPAPTPVQSTPAPTPVQSTLAPTSPTPAPTSPTPAPTPAPSILVPTLPTTPAPSTPVPTSPTPTPTPAPSTPMPTSPTPTPTHAQSNPPPASPTPPPVPSTSSLSETSFLDITNAAGELLSQTEIEELITVIVSGVHPNAQGRYACPLGDCPQVCKSRGDLRRHLRTKLHMPASYKCDRCGGVYTREDALKRHTRGCTARHR